ncbi:MAG: hypothetical protein M0D54_02240 [Hyphomonadaceae bacterium JAD_PAG50586_4]|nr:MAG: hypothetical protein M0D54_02240 [Hyphomonadaceae bacterium JAD_PAG50586_4]
MTIAKLKLELPNVLRTEAAGACRACGVELARKLQRIAAVSQAHVEGDPDSGLRICVHFNPSKEGKKRIHILAAQAASQVLRRREHVVLTVNDAKAAAKRVRGCNGVLLATELSDNRVLADFDPNLILAETLVQNFSEAPGAQKDDAARASGAQS